MYLGASEIIKSHCFRVAFRNPEKLVVDLDTACRRKDVFNGPEGCYRTNLMKALIVQGNWFIELRGFLTC
jgi:hypothetical protein